MCRSHLCGYDLNLSYPELAIIPTIIAPIPEQWGDGPSSTTVSSKAGLFSHISRKYKSQTQERRSFRFYRKSEYDKSQWKRDLINRPNGTLDPWYGCALLEEIIDYAVNFSLPWSERVPIQFYLGSLD